MGHINQAKLAQLWINSGQYVPMRNLAYTTKFRSYSNEAFSFTCLLDGGRGLCNSCIIADTTLVLREDPETISISHD